MNALESFARNIFYTIEVSRARVQKFVYNHIQRMKSADNPNLAAIIAATEVCWEALFGNLETYDEDLNMQRGLTLLVNKKIEEFKTKALKLEPIAESKFEKISPQYLELYPHGRTEYHNLLLKNVLVVMNRMVAATLKYSADIGADWHNEIKAIRDEFLDLFASQQTKIGDVDAATPDYEVKRDNMYIQLYRNLGTLMAEYATKPDWILTFWDQTIVNYVSHTKEVLIQKNSREAFELNWTAENDIYINNLSNGPIKYFFAPTADAETGTPIQEQASNTKVKITGAAANANDNKFVIFINETAADAKIEYRIE